jgi:hypothetical protein
MLLLCCLMAALFVGTAIYQVRERINKVLKLKRYRL